MGSGSYQRRTGNDFSHNMSQTMVSRCLGWTTDAMNENEIFEEFIEFPATDEKMAEIEERFFEISGMQGVMGAVDGTNIAIVAPEENEEAYLNRKHYHSINAMIVSPLD